METELPEEEEDEEETTSWKIKKIYYFSLNPI